MQRVDRFFFRARIPNPSTTKKNRDDARALAFFLGMERMLSDQALKQGRLEDALAHTGDEGRSKLR